LFLEHYKIDKTGISVKYRSRQLVRTRDVGEGNIKMDLQEIRWKGTRLINFSLDRHKWRLVAE
jgi:hypothetical protein